MKTESSLTSCMYLIISILAFLVALGFMSLVDEIEKSNSVNISILR